MAGQGRDWDCDPGLREKGREDLRRPGARSDNQSVTLQYSLVLGIRIEDRDIR